MPSFPTEIQGIRDKLRARFREDWREPINRGFLHIKTKDARLIPLIPNKTQKRLIDLIYTLEQENKPVRIVVLKERRRGISTIIEAMFFAKTSWQENLNAAVIAHDSDGTSAIFDMAKLFQDKMNIIIKSETKRSNAKEIVFSDNHSQIIIGNAQDRDLFRALTLHLAHFSEVGMYPRAEETMLGAMQTISELPGTCVILESTAKGINYFHKMVTEAKTGKSDWTLFFVPWFEDEDNTMPPPADFRCTEDYGNEIETQKRFNLTDGQMYWRRWYIINKCGGDLNLFMQEYPATVEEAFIGSGYPVFDHSKIAEIEPLIVNMPKERGYVLAYDYKAKTPIDDYIQTTAAGIGNLRIWHKPERGIFDDRYIICADTGGMWEKADYSCAYVLDRVKLQICALLHGHIDAYEYSDQLETLSLYYDNALIVPEINKWASETDDQGETVVDYLRKKGVRLYTRKVRDKQGSEHSRQYGWHTNAQTKGLLVDKLRKWVNEWADNPIVCNDIDLLNEMRTYIITETKTGKTSWEAQEGCKDDRVMAFGICLVVNDEMDAPQKISDNKEDYSKIFKSTSKISEVIAR